MSTAAGTVTKLEGGLAQEWVEVTLDQPTGFTYTSKLSTVYGCTYTASSDVSSGTVTPYYTKSGRVITFMLGNGAGATKTVFVNIVGRL